MVPTNFISAWKKNILLGTHFERLNNYLKNDYKFTNYFRKL